jgi:hypothetical protein
MCYWEHVRNLIEHIENTTNLKIQNFLTHWPKRKKKLRHVGEC